MEDSNINSQNVNDIVKENNMNDSNIKSKNASNTNDLNINSQNISNMKTYLEYFNNENNEIIGVQLSSINQSQTSLENSSHYLCKECFNFPSINFLEEDILEIHCPSHNFTKSVSIKDAHTILVYNDKSNLEKFNLNCKMHKKSKMYFYCKICKKSLCEDCLDFCEKEKHEIKEVNERTKIELNKIIKEIKNSSLYKNFNQNPFQTELNMDKESFSKGNNTIKLTRDKNDNKKLIIKNNEKESNGGLNTSDFANLNISNNSIESNNLHYFILFQIVFNDYKHFPDYFHINNIHKIYEKYNNIKKVDKNEIILIYKVENKRYVKLLGKKFIENNRDKCTLIIDNEEKEKELIEYFKLDERKKLKELRVRLIKKDNKNITNMSFIFHECNLLYSLEDISKWKNGEINNLSHAFHGCTSLTKIPDDISEWDTSNVTDMSYLFYFCSSLNTLPESINQWKTTKVNNFDYMFYGCGIKSIPNFIISPKIKPSHIHSKNIKIHIKTIMDSKEILLPQNATVKEFLYIIFQSDFSINENEKIFIRMGSNEININEYIDKDISDLRIKNGQNIYLGTNSMYNYYY